MKVDRPSTLITLTNEGKYMMNAHLSTIEPRHQIGTQEYHEALDEYIDEQAEEVMQDHDIDLSVVIADYCEEKNRWSEYDNMLRKACKVCPELKGFLLLAARRQAEIDLRAG